MTVGVGVTVDDRLAVAVRMGVGEAWVGVTPPSVGTGVFSLETGVSSGTSLSGEGVGASVGAGVGKGESGNVAVGSGVSVAPASMMTGVALGEGVKEGDG